MEPIYLKLNELQTIILEEIKQTINIINSKIKICIINFGNDPSSLSYIKGIKKSAEKININIKLNQYNENIIEEDFFNEFKNINSNDSYTGIIIQLPLPEQIDFHKIAQLIDYKKDLDCINPYNQGLLYAGIPFLIPATAFAISLTLDYIKNKYSYQLSGKNACIVGRSLSVGRPTFHLVLNKNITPTIIHTKTVEAYKITSNSDILIASCGIPEMINENWIKQDAVVIDVGIHSIQNEADECRLCGDIDYKSVIKKAGILTSVPGGIGLITSTLIFANAVKSYYSISKNENFIFNFEKVVKV